MHTVKRWTDPDSYVGRRWPAFYSAGFSQTRGSDPLTESNFATAIGVLEKLSTNCPACGKGCGTASDTCNTCHDFDQTVIVVRESHWACGWVEWIAIHESNTQAIAKAQELCERANDYPALDEDDWSEREHTAILDWWDGMSIRTRAKLCADCRENVFAARRDSPPDRVFEHLRENL